jgi:hypothetical protein
MRKGAGGPGSLLTIGVELLSHLTIRQTGTGIPSTSVADLGCLSRIPDPNFFHPGSEYFSSRIPDPHQRFKYFNPKKTVSMLWEI